MILWPWDDFVRPIRSYFARKSRTRWKRRRNNGVCSSCKLPFDNGKKRCVVDSCGHHRCYACLYDQDTCPLCSSKTATDDPQCKFKSIQTNETLEKENLNKSFNCKRQKLDDVQNYGIYYQEMKRFSQISNISNEFSFDVPISSRVIENVTLKPLYFEVPQSTEECFFLHRGWVYEQISEAILNSDVRGVVLEGIGGSGKTFLILQLVEWSSFGCNRKSSILDNISYSSWETLMKLSSLVVGYHFCQVDCRETCLVPDFIHSLAAQLCQAPQLEKYRNLLVQEESYQELLSLESCLENPDKAFLKGILEPLASNCCADFPCIIVIDSINESEGFPRSISSFLATYFHRFPSWLKVVITVNTDNLNAVRSLPLHRINLNCGEVKVKEDLVRYICSRVRKSPVIETNISACGNEKQLSRFAEYLITREKSSFLFVKLVLDLIEQNHLVVKSTTFNVIPVSLEEIFLLIFNLRFPSTGTFSKVRPILEVCLATFSPLTAVDIFYSIESTSLLPSVSWSDYIEILNSLSGLLIQRRDQSLMLSNTSLRYWLMKNKKFCCDERSGHTYLALLPTRLCYSLTPEKELELIYHVISCNLFEAEDTSKFLWIIFSNIKLSDVLINPRVMFLPDEQVLGFALKSGINPNSTLPNYMKYPVLNTLCKKGFENIVSMFLNFGANPNGTDIFGKTPLMEAAIQGHLEIAEHLLVAGAKIHLKDNSGRCALSLASENGHVEVVQLFLKKCNWPSSISCSQAKLRALIASAGTNNVEMCKYLINEISSEKDKNSSEFVSCELLLNKHIKPENLHQAAASGHLQSIRILYNKGIALDTKDKSQHTALSWACIYNKKDVVRFLLEKGADIKTKDVDSFNLLHIGAIYGDEELVKLLLENGVDAEAKNVENKTPLECAIATKHSSTALVLLEVGVNIGSGSFDSAQGNPKLYSILLNKLLSDGIALYKKGDILEANRRFEYALGKATGKENFDQIRTRVQEGLYLCKKKMITKN